MCIAVPMQITEINSSNTKAKVVLSGNELEIDIRLISPNVGDFVLVHAGCALEIIKKETADEFFALFSEIEENAQDGR